MHTMYSEVDRAMLTVHTNCHRLILTKLSTLKYLEYKNSVQDGAVHESNRFISANGKKIDNRVSMK